MKKMALSIVWSFILLFMCPILAEAQDTASDSPQLGLPLGVGWGDTPERIFSILKDNCEPIYDKEKREVDGLISGRFSYFIRYIFDEEGKLCLISQRSFSTGKENNIEHAIKLAERLADIMKEYAGTKICSSDDDHKNYLYKFDTPHSLIQMWVEVNNNFFNKLFKENVGIVHTTYGNPNANFKRIKVEPYSVFEEMNSSTHLPALDEIRDALNELKK